MQALVAYDRMVSGKTDLFDFTDLSEQKEETIITDTTKVTKPNTIGGAPKTGDTSSVELSV